MRRTQVLSLLVSFPVVIALQAQLPTNLDCKCTATGDGEYLCKCVPSKGTSETAAKKAATPTPQPTTTPDTSGQHVVAPVPNSATVAIPTAPSVTPSTAKATDAPTGTTTSTGQPIYTGPRGGQYHYSSSGKKVYTRRK